VGDKGCPTHRLGKKPVIVSVWDGWAFNRPLLPGGLNQSEAQASAFFYLSARCSAVTHHVAVSADARLSTCSRR
jgi:hypothetical protein